MESKKTIIVKTDWFTYYRWEPLPASDEKLIIEKFGNKYCVSLYFPALEKSDKIILKEL